MKKYKLEELKTTMFFPIEKVNEQINYRWAKWRDNEHAPYAKSNMMMNIGDNIWSNGLFIYKDIEHIKIESDNYKGEDFFFVPIPELIRIGLIEQEEVIFYPIY